MGQLYQVFKVILWNINQKQHYYYCFLAKVSCTPLSFFAFCSFLLENSLKWWKIIYIWPPNKANSSLLEDFRYHMRISFYKGSMHRKWKQKIALHVYFMHFYSVNKDYGSLFIDLVLFAVCFFNILEYANLTKLV